MTKTKSTNKVTITRHMTSIAISEDMEVELKFTELRPGEELGNGTDEDDELDQPSPIGFKYSIKSPRYPHKDFSDAMKKLRKHALAINEMNYGDAKALSDYNIIQVKIAGDVTLRQSRVVMVVSKYVNRTEKYVKFSTCQVTMYGESKYPEAADMTKLIESLIIEAEAYMNGKCQEEDQLPLFPAKRELMSA